MFHQLQNIVDDSKLLWKWEERQQVSTVQQDTLQLCSVQIKRILKKIQNGLLYSEMPHVGSVKFILHGKV